SGDDDLFELGLLLLYLLLGGDLRLSGDGERERDGGRKHGPAAGVPDYAIHTSVPRVCELLCFRRSLTRDAKRVPCAMLLVDGDEREAGKASERRSRPMSRVSLRLLGCRWRRRRRAPPGNSK